jgi:hypothetical protein
LLPVVWREWSDAELRAVIAHELAHIAGDDYAAWLMARLAVVAHFYHPLVRWLAGRLQLEQELAADMTAARLVGDSKEYLHSLASLALAMPANRMSGPARTLFPSRSLLVRRIEMLRSSGTNRPRPSAARYATLGVVALVGLAAAGLRGPGIDLTPRAVAQTPGAGEAAATATVATKVDRISLDIVPLDAMYVVSVRIADLAKDPGVGQMVRSLVARTPQFANTKLTANDVSEVMFVVYGSPREPQNLRIAIRFQTAEAKQRFTAWYEQQPGVEKDAERGVWKEGTHAQFATLDDATMVYDTYRSHGKEIAPLENVKPRWAAAWNERKDKLVLAAFEMPAELREAVAGKAPGAPGAAQTPGAMLFLAASPLINDMDWVVADLEFKDVLKVAAVAECKDQEAAPRVRDTAAALVVMVRNSLRAYSGHTSGTAPDQEAAILKRIMAEADRALATAEFTSKDNDVYATLQTAISTDDTMKLAMTLLPSVENARAAARGNQSMNNLKQLALAMHIYHDIYKVLPTAVGHTYRVGNETRTSKFPHSWRIDVLPFVEQQSLYDKYHFEEPWDSEANQEFAKQMPIMFRSPFDTDQQSTNTSYFVFTGDAAMFPLEKGAKFSQVKDGTSKTLMLVEAKKPVPWTKPEDITYTADGPVPKIESWMPGRLLVAFADGSARPISDTIDEATLRALITKAGGELVNDVPGPK